MQNESQVLSEREEFLPANNIQERTNIHNTGK